MNYFKGETMLMVVRKKVEAMAARAKRFANDLLNIYWNDHLLSEIKTVHARRHGFDKTNKEI